MTDEKTGRPLGPTGEAVRQNIKRIRADQRMPVTELSARLESIGRPIPPLGLRRIEDGKRRVDADDLSALAVALGVSPPTLLMPSIDSVAAGDQIEVTGLSSPIPAEKAWDWLTAQDTISAAQCVKYTQRRGRCCVRCRTLAEKILAEKS